MADKGNFLQKSKKGMDIGNKFLTVTISTEKGLQPCGLHSPATGFTYADLPYLYRLEDGWETPDFIAEKHCRKDETLELALEGRVGTTRIVHRFLVPADQPYIEESITVVNNGSEPVDSPDLAMGFTRTIGEDGSVCGELSSCRMVSVPFRRALEGRRDEYQDYSFEELIINHGAYWPPRSSELKETPELGAEGWVWTSGDHSLLVAKHSPDMIEHSILSVEKIRSKDILRFGGASIWHGDPEEGTEIAPGTSVSFSTTRYVLVKGGVRNAYYAFRGYMESLGHKTPPGFDPRVHWNELYDNPLWWEGDSFEKRKRLYTLAHMEEEASKAREVGCESLYLDPGWDTSFGSSLWPPYRLMEAEKFVELMRKKYGLEVSLHMPLAVWCDATAYPLEAHRRDERGEMLDDLCSASPAYVETKKRRLLELAGAGFVYFMFDGTAFTGECWDPSHGHSLPLKRSEHCKSILELTQEVHEEFPDLIIELHDPILGGASKRYPPMHYLHGLSASFDEGWAFEYMWDPMEDLISGRAISLYYYNLAYSLPLYIHIDLRKDNRNALEFWWYASTCRHLGMGGKHKDVKVWDAHKRAMGTYMRLKRFYTRGIFLGLGEDIHLHYLPGDKRAVLNVFNLDSKAVFKQIQIDLSEINFPGVSEVSDGEWKVDGDVLSIKLKLKARDTRVVEIVSS